MSGAALAGPTSRHYVSQRLRLHYVDWGNPDAPPLILQHGGRDHCRNWDWVAERLRDRWRVIAPDLRGHGDSAWSQDGSYTVASHVYDLAQLIHQQRLAPVTIIAHSFGAHVALRYAGIYPEAVARLVSIEGTGWASRETMEAMAARPLDERMRAWIDEERGFAGRLPRRYPSIEDAYRRMREENRRLTDAQARHLTEHGMNQNEDGTYSWKFDNYVRGRYPIEATPAMLDALFARIACPTLLVHGRESWATDPREDGTLATIPRARAMSFEGAGHWVHHDRLDEFLALVEAFLAEDGEG